jgi:hypothetical protein
VLQLGASSEDTHYSTPYEYHVAARDYSLYLQPPRILLFASEPVMLQGRHGLSKDSPATRVLAHADLLPEMKHALHDRRDTTVSLKAAPSQSRLLNPNSCNQHAPCEVYRRSLQQSVLPFATTTTLVTAVSHRRQSPSHLHTTKSGLSGASPARPPNLDITSEWVKQFHNLSKARH